MARLTKKGMRVSNNLISIGIDLAMNRILEMYHIPFGVAIQNIVMYNPYEIALSILALKLGITNKIILSVILAFLL